jgi:hypothetical protein
MGIGAQWGAVAGFVDLSALKSHLCIFLVIKSLYCYLTK